MANKKISALTGATTPLAGTELVPIAQSSATVSVSANDLTVRNFRANATTGILQVTGPTAASTRVVTVPDANWTAARTDAAQTFTGNQTVTGSITPSGLLDISAATAGQIQFPAAQNASSGANTLDDYEEGNWTPGLAFGGLAVGVTYYVQVGYYTKVGNIVHLSGFIFLSSKGTSTGSLTITGLPFTVVNNNAGFSTANLRTSKVLFVNQMMANVVTNSTTIAVVESTSLGVTTDLTDSDVVGDETSIIIYASYRVA